MNIPMTPPIMPMPQAMGPGAMHPMMLQQMMMQRMGAQPMSPHMPASAATMHPQMGMQVGAPYGAYAQPQAMHQGNSTGGSTLGTILRYAGIGAAAGFVYGMLPLPGGAIISSLIGAAGGAALGFMKARNEAKAAAALDQASMMQQAVQPSTQKAQRAVVKADAPAKAQAAGEAEKQRRRKRSQARRVTVKSGDTLGAIAKKLGTSVDRLHAANRKVIGNDPNTIFPGQKLVIPR